LLAFYLPCNVIPWCREEKYRKKHTCPPGICSSAISWRLFVLHKLHLRIKL